MRMQMLVGVEPISNAAVSLLWQVSCQNLFIRQIGQEHLTSLFAE
jgi:hypothetical protein